MRPVLLLTLLAAAVWTAPAQLPQPPREKIRIHGTVVDEHGKPVAGATIRGITEVWGQEGKLRSQSICRMMERVTDDKGNFLVELTKSDLGSAIRLRAVHGCAFTEQPLEIRNPQLDQNITLRISPQHARSCQVRVVDEHGKPIPGVRITAQQTPTMPGGKCSYVPEKMVPAKETVWQTDAEGRFTSPRSLDPDGNYLLQLKAEGFLGETTSWKTMGDTTTLDFGTVTLQRLQMIAGQVRDRQGNPIAGARLIWLDCKQRVQATSDASGQFRLQAAFAPPGFLFVEKEGFRFHGQRQQPGDAGKITLFRRTETSEKTMTTLPPFPRAQRKELAGKLLEPSLAPVLDKDDGPRYRVFWTLSHLDAHRLQAILEKRPLQNWILDSALRQMAAQHLGLEDLAAAQAFIATMKEPLYRCYAYLSLADDLPAEQQLRKLDLVRQAWQEGKQTTKPEQQVTVRAVVARRLWALDDKEEATRLLREGHPMAKALPAARDGGHARGTFAEVLAFVDLPAALDLLKEMEGQFAIRYYANMAHKIAATQPAEAERIFDLVGEIARQTGYDRCWFAVRLCHRMAPADLPRARRLAATSRDPCHVARAYAVMAQALAKTQPAEALKLLDEAYALLAKRPAAGHIAVMAGMLLPAAEQIDPALVPEFFWRTLSFCPPLRSTNGYVFHGEQSSLGSVALTLARYDRGIARSLLEQAVQPIDGPSGRSSRFYAAALIDPAWAVAMIEQLSPDKGQEETRLAVANFLLCEGEAVWRYVHRSLGQWHIDQEDF
jgi:protocatechuate 3,4-dioxygenase beta subunit